MRHVDEVAVPVHRDPWVAMAAGVDPRRWALELRRAHEGAFTDRARHRGLRSTIVDSWRRSVARGVPLEGRGAPDVLDRAALEERRRTHPLAGALPAIRSVLHPSMGEAQHIMVVSDEHGVLLWVEGPPRPISRAADDMNFVPGSDWSESGVGTNSIGTALAADHAIQVFSAEHYQVACHGWTCSGAPVHDPATGRLVGAIDITSDLSSYHPQAHALVLAAARVAEGVLAEDARRADRASAPGDRVLHVRALGRRTASCRIGGRTVELSPRHSELLVLLTLHPEGLSGPEVAAALYGDVPVPAVTVRAEVSRLRSLLGDVLGSRPYRLTAPVVADYLEVRDVPEPDVAPAASAVGGPLIGSRVPAIAALRAVPRGSSAGA